MALIWKNAVVENQPAKTIKMLTDQTPSSLVLAYKNSAR
jgi:hypothetical protein